VCGKLVRVLWVALARVVGTQSLRAHCLSHVTGGYLRSRLNHRQRQHSYSGPVVVAAARWNTVLAPLADNRGVAPRFRLSGSGFEPKPSSALRLET
jgi:hypothetical protein